MSHRTVMFTLALCVLAIAVAAPPASAASAKTDILLLFDTSGSMEDALEPAVEDISAISDRLRAELGDVAFGVAQVRDYPIAAFGNAGSGDVPYEAVAPITADRRRVENALRSLSAEGGGDSPEAYGRALRDAEAGIGLGWRPGARRLAILVADDLPHDDDLNWGIPESLHVESSPFDTLPDPGDDQVIGNGDDIDWQGLLGRLARDGLPLMFVLFEGDEEYLPYWQIWAGWTGGAAASADADDLSDIVVDLAKRGATATLPPCPPGESRDEARRCRHYSEWLGYSFPNGSLPAWARQADLGRDDVLPKEAVERLFADADLPAWWEFWRRDPRSDWWEIMDGGVCYGMALSGARFSTALEQQLWPAFGRTAASWTISPTPRLPAPFPSPDRVYAREMLQVLATDFVSQLSTEVQGSIFVQRSLFARKARAGSGAAALRAQLRAAMARGRLTAGDPSLAAEWPAGVALVAMWDQGGGHAVVAFDVRDTSDGGFRVEVWDNNRPHLVSTLIVDPRGRWKYPPLGWSGSADNLAFQPPYPARGLHYQSGGGTSGGRVTVVDLPSGARRVHGSAEHADGRNARLFVQPVPSAPKKSDLRTAVTDGDRVKISLSGRRAGATARGRGRILAAEGLTGAKMAGRASILYDLGRAMVSADGSRRGVLTVTRGQRRASSVGATALAMSESGGTVVRSRKGGRVRVSLSSHAGGPLASATIGLRLPRNGVASIGARQAKRAIGRGGRIRVRVRRRGRGRTVGVRARSVAALYRLQARVRMRGRLATLRVSTRRRLPRGAVGRVTWVVTRGGKAIRRKRVRLGVRRARTGRAVSVLRLPEDRRRIRVKAAVRIVVKAPAPAELRAVSKPVGARRIGSGRLG